MSDNQEELRRLIAAMPGGSLAAKVRQLMPAIDRQIREEGVRHKDIVALVNAHGRFPRPLTIHHFRWILADFRKRYRRGQVAPSADSSGEAALRSVAAGRDVAIPKGIPPEINANTGLPAGETRRVRPVTLGVGERISSKADLRRLRSMHVDLEALAKLAKKE